MTKISYIHGIPQDEWKDRGAEVPAQNFINYTALTDGELSLALLDEQLNILSKFYPENKEFAQGKTMLDNALYQGIHGSTPAWGILSPGLQKVARAINQASRKTGAANGLYIYGRNSNRVGGVNDPLVPMNDCDKILQGLEPGDPRWKNAQAAYKACVEDNKYRPILNKHLEKSAHHLLYEYAKAQQLNNYPTQVVVKSTLHKAGTGTLNQITKLSTENIRLWMRNGVMRSNAKAGTEPLQPEQTIQALAQNAGSGVNEPISIGVIIAIIGAIAGAISAAATLVAAFKGVDPANAQRIAQLQGIGTPTWGPENGDWYGYTGGGNGGNGGGGGEEETDFSQYALPIAIGAGALLLLK